MEPIEPTKLLRAYEQGHITEMELRSRLVQAAASYPPEGFVLLIPADELQAIRELAEAPPSSPDGSPRIFGIVSSVGPRDHEAEERRERRLWYDGIWCLHRYFQRGQAELHVPAIRTRDRR
jgi:hypothetical protein